MPGTHQLHSSIFHALAHLLVAALVIFIVVLLAVVPAWTQSAVPPTAREAAASPAFSSRLAQHVTPEAAGKSRASGQHQTGRVSPLDSGVLYENGPVNGTTDAWVINFGYVVSDTFTLSSASTVTGFDLNTWEFPGDATSQVDWSITSGENGGTVYGSGTVHVTDTFISTNQYGYDIDKITASGLNVTLNAGTFWFNVQNASVPSGDPVYWDENSGIGCKSSGCPSLASESAVGTIPSEAFDIIGTTGGGSDWCFKTSSHLQVLHDFTPQEGHPGEVTEGWDGIYGTTGGMAYKQNPYANGFTDIYDFTGGYNGWGGEVIAGPDLALYGAGSGGIQNCGDQYCGLIYRLRPSPVACRTSLCSWTEDVLYRVTGNNDATSPGNLVFDQAGNLYGTSLYGGAYGQGAIFELTPSNGAWMETILYSFTGSSDGATANGLVMGTDGNLYGTTEFGGDPSCNSNQGCGTFFQLVPSGGGWTMNVLYTFHAQDHIYLPGGLVRSQKDAFVGRAVYFGDEVFMLAQSQGNWSVRIVWQGGQSEGIAGLGGLGDWPVGIASNGCGGGDCSAAQAPANGYFYFFVVNGDGSYTIEYRDSGSFPPARLTGSDYTLMWGTTYDCGSFNYGTLWKWSYYSDEYPQRE